MSQKDKKDKKQDKDIKNLEKSVYGARVAGFSLGAIYESKFDPQNGTAGKMLGTELNVTFGPERDDVPYRLGAFTRVLSDIGKATEQEYDHRVGGAIPDENIAEVREVITKQVECPLYFSLTCEMSIFPFKTSTKLCAVAIA